MATTSALETLVDLATKETDEATKRLGRAVRSREEAQQKLGLLEQYRDDYAAQFQKTLSAGLSPMAYRNYQLFIEKIDDAIRTQESVVQDAGQHVEQARQAWQACERKRMTYNTLTTRAKDAASRKEAKADQKLMDEYAARIAYYKR